MSAPEHELERPNADDVYNLAWELRDELQALVVDFVEQLGKFYDRLDRDPFDRA